VGDGRGGQWTAAADRDNRSPSRGTAAAQVAGINAQPRQDQGNPSKQARPRRRPPLLDPFRSALPRAFERLIRALGQFVRIIGQVAGCNRGDRRACQRDVITAPSPNVHLPFTSDATCGSIVAVRRWDHSKGETAI
jgi:hypothetical protein